ncbi:hypothetical protein V6N13_051142 [Hibiscus sabdariffa]
MGYIQMLEKLGFPLKNELATVVIMQSLLDNFKPFVLSFNMNEIDKTLPQLLGMLRTAKSDLKKNGSKSNDPRSEKKKWNGVSERRNQTLLDMFRSMMSHTDLPTSLWGYALETIAFTLNRVASKLVQKTPHEMWTGKRPNMSFMKVWGCKAYVKHQMSTKLELKSHKCTSVGYPKETNGYYFFNPEKTKCLLLERESFLKKNFSRTMGMVEILNLKEVQQQQVNEPEVEQASQVVQENSTDLETQPLRRSKTECHEPERYGFLITTHGDVILMDQDEPKTYQEAVSSPDSEKWLEAIRSEIDSTSEKPSMDFG